MKKIRNVEWGNYRHPDFLQSLTMSVNELKFIRVFLKRGSAAMVTELLREQKAKRKNYSKNEFPSRFQKRERIKA